MEELNKKLAKLIQDYQNEVIILDEALIILEDLIKSFSQNIEENNITLIRIEFQNLLMKINNLRKINKKLCSCILDNVELKERLNIV